MNTEIQRYNSRLSASDKAVCNRLMKEIDGAVKTAKSKLWHGHPVWFLDGNPIVGYSKLNDSVRLLFWSGQGFAEKGLQNEGKFKAAEARYTNINEINATALRRWLKKAKIIQWDYKNIVKRKGKLLRLSAAQIRDQSKRSKVYGMNFARVYPLYVAKAKKKGRTKQDVDAIICWLTGYTQKQLQAQIKKQVDFETIFSQAPRMNPSRKLITGVVCGVRVENIQDPIMRDIRYLDKLIDELAKGKTIESILRKKSSTE